MPLTNEERESMLQSAFEGASTTSYDDTERGITMDLLSRGYRGLIGFGEGVSSAIDTMQDIAGVEDPYADNASDRFLERRRGDAFARPDRSEYLGREGTLKRWVGSAIESIPRSLGGSVGGATAGAVLTGGTPIGAIAGGLVGLTSIAGLGTYGDIQKKYKGLLPQDELDNLALNTAAWELGPEMASQALTGGIGSALFKGAVKGGLKSTVKNLMSRGGKDLALDFGAIATTEIGGEMLTAYQQQDLLNKSGLSNVDPVESAKEAFGPSLIMSLLFFGGAEIASTKRRGELKAALNSTNPAIKAGASEVVYNNLKKKDPELAAAWDTYAQPIVKTDGVSFNIEDDFQEIANEITTSEVVEDVSTEAIMSKDQDIKDTLKTSVDSKLGLVFKEPFVSELKGDKPAPYKPSEKIKATQKAAEVRQEEEKYQEYEPIDTPGYTPIERYQKGVEPIPPAARERRMVENKVPTAQDDYQQWLAEGKPDENAALDQVTSALTKEPELPTGATEMAPKQDLVEEAPVVSEVHEKPLEAQEGTLIEEETFEIGSPFIKKEVAKKMGKGDLHVKTEEAADGTFTTTLTVPNGNNYIGVGKDLATAKKDAVGNLMDVVSPKASEAHTKIRSKASIEAAKDADLRTPEVRKEHQLLINNIVDADTLVTAASTIAGKDNTLHKIGNYLKSIAGKKQLRDINVRVDKNKVNAYYDHRTNTIVIGSGINANKAEVVSEVLLHELDHALTVQKFKQGGWFATRMNELFEEAKDNLSREDRANLNKWEATEANKDLSNFKSDFNTYSSDVYYGLLDPFEFMAQMTTNKDMQEYLKSIKVESPSKKISTLWDKFVAMMGKVFGVSPSDYNLLSEALTVQEELIKQEVSDTKQDQILANRMIEKSYSAVQGVEDIDVAGLDVSGRRYTQAERTAIMLDGAKDKESFKERAITNVKQLGKISKDMFQGISDRLGEYHKSLGVKMRELDSEINQNVHRNMIDSQDFIKWYEKIDESDKATVKDLLYHRKVAELKELFPSMKGFEKIERMLERIEESAYKLGLVRDKLPNYFPRHVNDINGFIEWMQEKGEKDGLGQFNHLIQKREKELGRPLSDAEKNQVYTDALKTGRHSVLPKPGSTKERTIKEIHPDALKFYASPVESLMNHIYEMNTKIAAEGLIGSTKRVSLIKEIRDIQSKLTNKDMTLEERDILINRAEAATDRINDSEKFSEESIADLIRTLDEKRGKDEAPITAEDQREIIRLIRARLMERGMNGPLAKMRNVALMATLGNVSSSITQIGDQVLSAHAHGWKNAVSGMISAFNGKVGDRIVDSFDFSQQYKEFAADGTTQGLDKLLTWTGLKKMDLFGKESFLRARQKKISNSSLDTFLKEYEDFANGDIDKLTNAYTAIKEDKINEDGVARDIMFASLAEYQPVGISEMPYHYVLGGNMRSFYILKSFAIKALNTVAREAKKGYKEGGISGAIKKGGYLFTLLTLAGAGTDEIKDFLLGREKDLSDNVMDNIFQLMMMNRYAIDKGIQSGDLVQSVVMGQAPPTRFLTDGGKDFYSLVTGETPTNWIKYIPVVGRQAYSRGTEVGRGKVIKGEKRDVSNMEDARRINRDIISYNKGKNRDDKIQRIDLRRLNKRLKE